MSYTSVALTRTFTPRAWARLGNGARRRPALAAAAVTLLAAWAGLILAHTTLRPVMPRAAALRTVRSDAGLRPLLARAHWRRAELTPLDSRTEQLGLYRGARIVATVTIARTRSGWSLDATDLTRQSYAFGSNIANEPVVLAGLAALFILVTAVWPLWRLRNLDSLVAAGSALSIVLFNRWTLDRMVLVSYPALIYLTLRCAWQALAPPGCRLPATPLHERLTRRWPAAQRLRVLRLLVGMLALITMMVGLTSLHVIDVGYAVMEGATKLAHGVLPYGQIPDILHGDTYPIGSYLLYAPLGALWPVRSVWDNAGATLFVAVAAGLLAAWLTWRMVGRAGDPSRGLSAAIAVLAFPPMLVTVSTGTTDVVLAAMLALALLLWCHPTRGSAALAVAAWFKAAPALLVPLLLAPLRGRSLARALTALLAVSAAMLGVVVVLGGSDAVAAMVRAVGFQFTRASPHTLWALTGSMPFQPLVEAATLALVAGGAIKLRTDHSLAGDRVRLAALLGAVLLGLQIAASYWNYMYLVWAIPFLVLALFSAPPGAEPEASR